MGTVGIDDNPITENVASSIYLNRLRVANWDVLESAIQATDVTLWSSPQCRVKEIVRVI
jgi:hypothetical protein